MLPTNRTQSSEIAKKRYKMLPWVFGRHICACWRWCKKSINHISGIDLPLTTECASKPDSSATEAHDVKQRPPRSLAAPGSFFRGARPKGKVRVQGKQARWKVGLIACNTLPTAGWKI